MSLAAHTDGALLLLSVSLCFAGCLCVFRLRSRMRHSTGLVRASWIFLTGPKKEIDEFTTKGMLQALSTDPTNPAATVHSTRFLVIDREGQIRILRKLDEPELVQKLLMDIGSLLREPFSKSSHLAP